MYNHTSTIFQYCCILPTDPVNHKKCDSYLPMEPLRTWTAPEQTANMTQHTDAQ